jgi:hypothetical protein
MAPIFSSALALAQATGQDSIPAAQHALFKQDGVVWLPLGYERWQHVGTRVETMNRTLPRSTGRKICPL